MLRHRWKLGFGVAFFGLSMACTPEIGDKCRTDRDCAGVEARICDTSTPGGYCTIADCRPNECPNEAVCVNFGNESACMLRCDKKSCPRGDEGFVCRKDIGAVDFCYLPADED